MVCRRKLFPAFLCLLTFVVASALPASAQGPPTVSFLAQHYDVSAALDGVSQMLTATAKVEFRALEVASTVRVELHPNLQVKEVKSADGKLLAFERDNQNPLFLSVSLPASVPRESKLTLSFSYSGLLANAENSPVPGMRVALIDRESAYLLLPARWFPLTNFPSNRYTGTFKVIVPDTFVVVGTGKSDPPVAQPALGRGDTAKSAYTFHCDTAGPVGTFVAGSLQLSPVQVEGLSASVYTPPAQAPTAKAYAT